MLGSLLSFEDDDELALDDLFDADLFRDDCPPTRVDSTLSDASVSSEISAASTSFAPSPAAASQHPVATAGRNPSGLVIEAFCTFNATIVHLEYPISEHGWILRSSLCSNTCLRWDLGDHVCIMSKKSTCAKAMVDPTRPRRSECKNCVMRKTWRRECKLVDHTFYLFALQDISRTIEVLQPLLLATAPAQNVQMYLDFQPKLNNSAKKDNDVKATNWERKVHFTILNGGSGRVRMKRPSPHETMVQMLMECGDLPSQIDSTAPEAPDAPVPLPPPPTALAGSAPASKKQNIANLAAQLSMPIPIASERSVSIAPPQTPLLATPVAVRAAPVLTTVVASPQRKKKSAVDAYNRIIDVLIYFDAKQTVAFPAQMIRDILTSLPICFQGIASLESNEYVDHLYAVMDIDHSPTLIVKSSVLQQWLIHLSSSSRDIRVQIGFFCAPTVQVYHELRTDPLMPPFLTQNELSMHYSYQQAKSFACSGTLPVLCAYHSVDAKVYAASVLPVCM